MALAAGGFDQLEQARMVRDEPARISRNHFRSWLRREAATEEHFVAALDPGNSAVWYVLVVNLAPPLDGEYLFRVTAPPGFPQKPPEFTALTPNGVFEINGPLCISIGKYHPQNYAQALGMDGFMRNAAMCLATFDSEIHGIGVTILPAAEQQRLANRSLAYNAGLEGKAGRGRALVEEAIAAHPDFLAARLLLARRAARAGAATATETAAATHAAAGA
jgi:ubiquitin-protein ligase